MAITLTIPGHGNLDLEEIKDLVYEENIPSSDIQAIYPVVLQAHKRYTEAQKEYEESYSRDDQDEDDEYYDDYDAPDEDYEEILSDLESILIEIAGQENTPNYIRLEMAKSTINEYVRTSALEKLSLDDVKDILKTTRLRAADLKAIADNKDLDLEAIELVIDDLKRFPSQDIPYIIAALINRDSITEELLVEFYNINKRYSNENIKYSLAKNEKTPLDILVSLAKDPNFKDKKELVKNKNFPTDLLYLLPIDRLTASEMLVKRKNLPVEIIEAIHEEYKGEATQEDAYIDGMTLIVLQDLVNHPNTPEEIFNYYSFTKNATLLNALLSNKKVSPDLALEIYNKDKKDPPHPVVYKLLYNNDTDPTIIREIYNNFYLKLRDWDYNNMIALNTNTPVDILEELTEKYVDDVSRVAVNLAWNKSTPAHLLRYLETSKNRLVRETVASNPHTPVDILEKLLTDPNENVSNAAMGNISLPDELKTQYIIPKKKDKARRTKEELGGSNVNFEDKTTSTLQSKINADLELLKRLKSYLQ